MVRGALGTLRLDLEADIDVAARVADGEVACRVLHARSPDLPVIDIETSEFSGLEMALRIQRQQLLVRVAMVTPFVSPGLPGLLWREWWVGAIRQVYRGAARAIQNWHWTLGPSEADSYNHRERRVLRLAGEGAMARDMTATPGFLCATGGNCLFEAIGNWRRQLYRSGAAGASQGGDMIRSGFALGTHLAVCA